MGNKFYIGGKWLTYKDVLIIFNQYEPLKRTFKYVLHHLGLTNKALYSHFIKAAGYTMRCTIIHPQKWAELKYDLIIGLERTTYSYSMILAIKDIQNTLEFFETLSPSQKMAVLNKQEHITALMMQNAMNILKNAHSECQISKIINNENQNWKNQERRQVIG